MGFGPPPCPLIADRGQTLAQDTPAGTNKYSVEGALTGKVIDVL
jgi:hypothetical protein